MGFIMDGLEAEGYDRSYTDRQLLNRIFAYFRPHLGAMAFVALMIVLDSLMSAVLPILIASGIDTLAIDQSWQRARLLIVAILVSTALAWTFNFFRQWYTARTVGDVVLELREAAFDAVMARDMSFYDEYPSGKIVSRVTSDTQDFANVVSLTLNLISQVLLVVIIFGVLFYVDARLALIAGAIAPVIVVVALGFRRLARITTQQARRVLAEVNAKVQETVSGIAVAKAFRQEAAIYAEFAGGQPAVVPHQSAPGLCLQRHLPRVERRSPASARRSSSILAA